MIKMNAFLEQLINNCIDQLYQDQSINCPLCGQINVCDSSFSFSQNKNVLSKFLVENISPSNHTSQNNSPIKTVFIKDIKKLLSEINQDRSYCINDMSNIKSLMNKLNNLNQNKSPKMQQIGICEDHQRQYEAFCWSCRLPLCIDCLLTQDNHRSHEILNIDKSLDKENQQIQVIQDKLVQNKAKMQKQQAYIRKYKSDLEKFAIEQTSQINQFFKDLREMVEQRYDQVKSQMKESIDTKSKWAREKDLQLKNIMNNLSTTDFQLLSIQLCSYNKIDQLLQSIEKENIAIIVNEKAEDAHSQIKQQFLEEFDFNEEIQLITKKISNLQYSYCDTFLFSARHSLSGTRRDKRQRSGSKTTRNSFSTNKIHNITYLKRESSQSSLKSSDRSRNHSRTLLKKNIQQFKAKDQLSQSLIIQMPFQEAKYSKLSKKQVQNQSIQKSKKNQKQSKSPQKVKNIIPKLPLQRKNTNQSTKNSSQIESQKLMQSLRKLQQQQVTTPSSKNSKKIDLSGAISKTVDNTAIFQSQKKTQKTKNTNQYKAQTMKNVIQSKKQSINNSISRIFVDGIKSPLTNSDESEELQNIVANQRNYSGQFKNEFNSKKSLNNTTVIQKEEQDYKQPLNQSILNEEYYTQQNQSIISQSRQSLHFYRPQSLKDKRNSYKSDKRNSVEHQLFKEQWQQRQLKNVENLSQLRKTSEIINQQQLNNKVNQLINQKNISNNQLEKNSFIQQFSMDSEKVEENQQFQNQSKTPQLVLIGNSTNNNQIQFQFFDVQQYDFTNSFIIESSIQNFQVINDPRNQDQLLCFDALNKQFWTINLSQQNIELSDIVSISKKQEIRNFRICSGHSQYVPLLYVALQFEEKEAKIYRFDFEDKLWIQLPDIEHFFEDLQMVVFDNSLHIICTQNNHEQNAITNYCLKFDVDSDIWIQINCFKQQITNYALANLGDQYLIVIGGYDGNKVLKSCLIYDKDTKEWITIEDLQYERQNAKAVCIDNKVYLIGGTDKDGKIQQIIEQYDFYGKKQWKIVGDIEDSSFQINSVLPIQL